ncbi:MAG: hypothetical protein ACKOC8_10015 [Pirellulales bacterium]
MDRRVLFASLLAGIAVFAGVGLREVTAGDRFRHPQGCTGACCEPGRCGGGHAHCGRGCRHCGHCGGHGCCLCGPGACKYDAWEKRYFLRSQGKSWHSTWYDPAEGRPIALVVPPTSEFVTQYSWGVPSSRVTPIYHQFRRPYPGPGGVAGSGGGFLPTPNQPSDTVQFGVNAVRGPWGAY